LKILLVEDDDIKSGHISKFLSNKIPELIIDNAKSYQSALKKIVSSNYDLIILDMTLPTFDISADESGGRPQAYAGREILRQMDRRNINVPVIVVTQFDKFGEGKDSMTLKQLESQLRLSHPSNYICAIYYSSTIDDWKNELTLCICKLRGEDA
jgi:CheY-like chemotaxis protein